jgi:hypothetical protein
MSATENTEKVMGKAAGFLCELGVLCGEDVWFIYSPNIENMTREG